MSYDPHSATYVKEIENLKAEIARMRPVVDAAIARHEAEREWFKDDLDWNKRRNVLFAAENSLDAAVAQCLKERG